MTTEQALTPGQHVTPGQDVTPERAVTPEPAPVDGVLDRLRALDSCAVSDALDAYGLASVVLGPAPVWQVDRVIAGRVRTVTAGPRRSDRPAGHIAAAAVDISGPDDVIVIANDGRLDVSCWGGILSRAAVARGVAGVVVDGACRDASESRDLGMPVFARAVVPVSARGRVVQLAMDETIRFGEIDVGPGDFVIADGNGVAFVPGQDAERIVAFAERIVAREAAMAEAVDRGRPVADVMHDSQFPATEESGS
ncbi:4-carboxy-4-hydroxy-2-oxoadipate aldolase/oxaloacetate decarboxylase [Streptomyces sp. AcH 505]|uniref:RraA family protein n=1 Tax=Streptomyces sp. AcH 505 TaxID=352211 RepID=UPI00099B8FCB